VFSIATSPTWCNSTVSTLAGVLAERLLEYVPYLDRSFLRILVQNVSKLRLNSHVERPAGRVSLTAPMLSTDCPNGALSLTDDPNFRGGFGQLLPGCTSIPFNDLAALEQALASRQIAAFIVEPIQGKGVQSAPPTSFCRRGRAMPSLRDIAGSPTKSRPESAGPGDSSRSSTGTSNPTWSCSPRRCRAVTFRSARC